MSQQFSPKLIFRLLPPPLLNEYFSSREQSGLVLQNESQAGIDRLYKQWEALPPDTRDKMEAELRAVHDMATSDTALATLLEEAAFHDHRTEEVQQAFANLNTLHEKMLWTLIHQPRIFEVANTFELADNLSSRYWRKCTGLPRRAPKDKPADRDELAAALRQYFLNREDRGRNCHVDAYKRGTDVYYFAYLEDYARLGVTFDNQGRYQRQTLKDSFEIVFRYDPIEGSLETHVRAKREMVLELQTIFARVCLESELPSQAQNQVVYQLNKLRSRSFAFPTEPGDGIVSTRVKSLKLTILGSQKRILLEEGDGKNPAGIYDLLDSISGVNLALLSVTWAKLQMVFYREKGRDKTLNIGLSYNSCNLKDRREDLIARKYLKRWGLELHSVAEGAAPEPVHTG
ncbi:MAG: hypothetical protein NC819_02120 [Candidatus Omnitrophica bacterium]|nr:hypothetical protein [Candidatus Omnitrophota bacterium]